MTTKAHRIAALVAFSALSVAAGGCGITGSLGKAACPEIGAGRDVLAGNFAADARVNAKVRTFVQAANDLAGVAGQIETEVAHACLRMGADLGVSQTAMAAKKEPGGRASGACEPVLQAIDQILRAGVVVQVSVTPPVCQASAQASAQCQGACSASPGDAECGASCQAHANVHASCTPAVVTVNAQTGDPRAQRLVTTLQQNLPVLIHAEIALGKRLIHDGQVIAKVGANLPKIVGQAGVHALGCIGAAVEASASASIQINVSVQASFKVTSRVGASHG